MSKNGSSSKNVRTAAIVLLLLCFLSAAASLSLFACGAHFSGRNSLACDGAVSSAGMRTLSAKASMRTGEWVAVVAVITVGALAFLALLLFMLVFPIINRIAGTHIPCFDLFSSAEKSDKQKAASRRETTKTADKKEGYVDDRYVKTVRIDTLYRPEQEEEKKITASSIDRAARQATQNDGGKKKK